MKTKLFDTYRLAHKFDKAYELLREVVEANSDNQSIMLVGGHVAMKNEDVELCKELWKKAAEMEDESMAKQVRIISVKSALQYVLLKEKNNRKQKCIIMMNL